MNPSLRRDEVQHKTIQNAVPRIDTAVKPEKRLVAKNIPMMGDG